MRSIWSGAISFGLVNIPIKLYVATDEQSLDFAMLHKKDCSPIRFARVCKREEKEVPFHEIIKGAAVGKDDFVVLSDEEIQQANVKKTRSIEIQQFVEEQEIDTIYFEKPYYIEPANGSEKSYALLTEAMKKAGKVAVAKFVLRTRERLVVLKPKGNVLVLNQLRYHQDIRDTKDLKLPEENSVTEKEVKMALAFIEQLSGAFDPVQYRDTYTNELKKLIETKAKGERVSVKGEEPVPTKVDDLMSLLKQSLEQERSREHARLAH